jgi:hypothetical protein
MGNLSIIAMAGTTRDLEIASQFPPEVKWDRVVKVVVPDDHGYFPDVSHYEAVDFERFESTMEDGALFRYMAQCVDAVLDFTNKNTDRLTKMNFTVHCAMHGMKTGGQMFVVAGFVDYQPLRIDKRRSLNLISGHKL